MISFLSTKAFKRKFTSGSFSENEFLSYFFLTVIYDTFFHSLSASRVTAGEETIWFQLVAWSFFVCTVAIWLTCFIVNGALKGDKLLYKVVPLSITVGYKYAVVMLALGYLSNSVLEIKLLWFNTLIVYSVNLLMLLNVVYHLNSINRKMANK